jgi:chromosome segregation ATPase
MPPGRPSKEKDKQKAAHARNGKALLAPSPGKENRQPAVEKTSQTSPKRKRSNSENLDHWYRKQKAEHETVKRHDKALKKVRTELADVRSLLTCAESTSNGLQADRDGLTARLSAACMALEARNELYMEAAQQLDTAQRQLIFKDSRIAQLERNIVHMSQKLSSTQQRANKLYKTVRRYKAQDHRDAAQNTTKNATKQHVFVL